MRVAQLEKIIAADVGHQVAERAIGGDDIAAEAALVEPRRREIEPDQRTGCQLGPDLRPVGAVSEVGADRGKNVAPVKS